MLTNRTAKIIKREKIYPEGKQVSGVSRVPTVRTEYECPCGKGKIISEQVSGFGEYEAYMECEECDKKYYVLTGCGNLWELRKRG